MTPSSPFDRSTDTTEATGMISWTAMEESDGLNYNRVLSWWLLRRRRIDACAIEAALLIHMYYQ